MTGKIFVNTSKHSIIYDRKNFLPMLRFVLDYGFIPDGADPEDIFATTLNGCIASFGGGDTLKFTPPMQRIGFRYVTMTVLSPRVHRLVFESLKRSGATDLLKTRVDEFRRVYWGKKDFDGKAAVFAAEEVELESEQVEE